jgi:hypothetical protein
VIRHFRMIRMLLLSSFATMVFLPNIVVDSPLFAQSREGKEWGQLMCPLLCCSSSSTPGIALTWWQTLIVLVVLIAMCVFLGYLAEKDEQERLKRCQSANSPDPIETPNVMNRRVTFDLDGKVREGVVVGQHEDILSVNFLTDTGQLATTNVEYAKVMLKT